MRISPSSPHIWQVLTPLPPDPAEAPKASTLRRLYRGVTSLVRRKPRERYEEADISDDGGAYPRQMNV